MLVAIHKSDFSQDIFTLVTIHNALLLVAIHKSHFSQDIFTLVTIHMMKYFEDFYVGYIPQVIFSLHIDSFAGYNPRVILYHWLSCWLHSTSPNLLSKVTHSALNSNFGLQISPVTIRSTQSLILTNWLLTISEPNTMEASLVIRYQRYSGLTAKTTL